MCVCVLDFSLVCIELGFCAWGLFEVRRYISIFLHYITFYNPGSFIFLQAAARHDTYIALFSWWQVLPSRATPRRASPRSSNRPEKWLCWRKRSEVKRPSVCVSDCLFDCTSFGKERNRSEAKCMSVNLLAN